MLQVKQKSEPTAKAARSKTTFTQTDKFFIKGINTRKQLRLSF